MDKTVFIMRGTSGSGKSHWAREKAAKICDEVETVHYPNLNIILSTDDYWVDRPFSYDKLGEAHSWNLARFLQALRQKYLAIFIDNTNMKLYEFQNYIGVAQMMKYKVIVVDCTPQTMEGVIELRSIFANDHPGRRFIHDCNQCQYLGSDEVVGREFYRCYQRRSLPW